MRRADHTTSRVSADIAFLCIPSDRSRKQRQKGIELISWLITMLKVVLSELKNISMGGYTGLMRTNIAGTNWCEGLGPTGKEDELKIHLTTLVSGLFAVYHP